MAGQEVGVELGVGVGVRDRDRERWHTLGKASRRGRFESVHAKNRHEPQQRERYRAGHVAGHWLESQVKLDKLPEKLP